MPRSLAGLRTSFPSSRTPYNLERLTPPWLRLQVVTPGSIRMRVGTRIEYRLRLRGVPIRWISEITAWEPPYRFVDRQVTGPYRLWIHEHRFRDSENGAICEGHGFGTPSGGGALVNWLAVGTDVKRIFGLPAGKSCWRSSARVENTMRGCNSAMRETGKGCLSSQASCLASSSLGRVD